jgi:hypothetical protein
MVPTLIHDTGRKSTALGLIELPIISGAVTYDHLTTCKVYILVFHQAIYCRKNGKPLDMSNAVWREWCCHQRHAKDVHPQSG